jgi:hypothetical protein
MHVDRAGEFRDGFREGEGFIFLDAVVTDREVDVAKAVLLRGRDVGLCPVHADDRLHAQRGERIERVVSVGLRAGEDLARDAIGVVEMGGVNGRQVRRRCRSHRTCLIGADDGGEREGDQEEDGSGGGGH